MLLPEGGFIRVPRMCINIQSTWRSGALLITLANIILLPVLYALFYTANGQKAAKAV